MKNTEVKLPIAEHGLHKHDYNFPYLGTCNFMEVFPVYIKPLKKGEKDHPKAGLFSRLNPVTNPAFATGRYNFKGFFVPYKYVYRPWYSMTELTEYQYSGGTTALPTYSPFTTLGQINKQIVGSANSSDLRLKFVSQVTDASAISNGDYDIEFLNADNSSSYFTVDPAGARLLKVLQGLGTSPTWIEDDPSKVHVQDMLSYVRIFLDYYFPSQYVGGSSLYDVIVKCIHQETNDYSNNTLTQDILNALALCSLGFYDSSIFDCAFDNPVAPSAYPDASIALDDITNNTQQVHQVVTNYRNGAAFPPGNLKPDNGTPFVGSSLATAANTTHGVVTQYIIDALQSLNNFVKRHQLAGGRLIDRMLASRGVVIDHDYIQKPYFLGEYNVEIEIDAVTNNSNTNLGELAGKGVAATEKPMSFDVKADDDGIFIVMCCVKPDCDLPVYNDPYTFYVDSLDYHHAEFDKLGADIIPSLAVSTTMKGTINSHIVNSNPGFGFSSRYYGYLAERTRLTGDFRLKTRGSDSLGSFYTFRKYSDATIAQNQGLKHSVDFVSSYDDWVQYQRLFNTDKMDNLQLFIRWFGSSYQHKLPLGESFDWDDDEYNKKVKLIQSGAKI